MHFPQALRDLFFSLSHLFNAFAHLRDLNVDVLDFRSKGTFATIVGVLNLLLGLDLSLDELIEAKTGFSLVMLLRDEHVVHQSFDLA